MLSKCQQQLRRQPGVGPLPRHKLLARIMKQTLIYLPQRMKTPGQVPIVPMGVQALVASLTMIRHHPEPSTCSQVKCIQMCRRWVHSLKCNMSDMCFQPTRVPTSILSFSSLVPLGFVLDLANVCSCANLNFLHSVPLVNWLEHMYVCVFLRNVYRQNMLPVEKDFIISIVDCMLVGST